MTEVPAKAPPASSRPLATGAAPAVGSSSRSRRPSRRRSLLLWVVLPLAVAFLGAAAGITTAALIRVPSVESLGDFSPGLITQVFDRDDTDFQSYFRERRVMLREGEVPLAFEQALLATEDQNFYDHGGVDLQGAIRAAYQNLTKGERFSGASTLTMQLARTLFLTREKTWNRKFREVLVAVELEKRYSKQQLLTLYANLMNFSGGNYGIESASRDYFNKPAAELEIHEAATLVAILPRPSDWNPRTRPEIVLRRRDTVLDRLLAEGYLDEQEHAAAVAEPLLIRPRRRERRAGAYFAEEVRRYLYDTYGETGLYDRGLQVRTTLDADAQRAAERALRDGLVRIDRIRGWRGPVLSLDEGGDLETVELPSWAEVRWLPGEWVEGLVTRRDGARAEVRVLDQRFALQPEAWAWTRRDLRRLLSPGDVAWFRLVADSEHTDADAAAQAGEEAEAGEVSADGAEGAPEVPPAERFRLELMQEPELEGALVLLESATGAVRAMVGGWDFERNEFNRATQARRQVGSAFKPFVFGAALEANYTPADTLFDAPCVFAGADNLPNYSPRNFYRSYNGIVTLRRALEKSMNVTSVKLLDMVGVERVVDFARRAGIRSELPPYPSLALGVAELSPLELAAAYATIGNQGFFIEPYLIESVSTSDGRVLERHEPRASRAMEPTDAYLLTHMLEGVIDRGTGVAVRDLDLDLAGKTGTTDGYTDAWFAGFSPTHTLVVWVGFDIKRKIGPNMTGAEAALPIWRQVVATGIDEGWIPRGERFSVPPGIVFRRVEGGTGLLATPDSEAVVVEAFKTGTEPTQSWDRRWNRILNLPWYQQRPFYGIPKEGENMPEDIEDWTLVLDAREGVEREEGAEAAGSEPAAR